MKSSQPRRTDDWRERTDDVPSPIDLRTQADAEQWEATAGIKRPWRDDFFERIVGELADSQFASGKALELGSGPGFLAERALTRLPNLSLALLDFSEAMHALARRRIGDGLTRASFHLRDFRDPRWPDGLGRFQCVMTHQAVHELRHKRRAPALHRQVRHILDDDGIYLVADHFAGVNGMQNDRLFMTEEEQRLALQDAGFARVERLMIHGGIVLHRAEGIREPPSMRASANPQHESR